MKQQKKLRIRLSSSESHEEDEAIQIARRQQDDQHFEEMKLEFMRKSA